MYPITEYLKIASIGDLECRVPGVLVLVTVVKLLGKYMIIGHLHP